MLDMHARPKGIKAIHCSRSNCSGMITCPYNMLSEAGLCWSRHHVVQALLEHAAASNVSVSLRCQHPGDAQMDSSTSLRKMQQSKFCLMMPGVHHATVRLSEAILAGMGAGTPGACMLLAGVNAVLARGTAYPAQAPNVVLLCTASLPKVFARSLRYYVSDADHDPAIILPSCQQSPAR